MNRLAVIGTAHGEGGACTSGELLKIIQGISPEAIFCEASAEAFPEMLNATETFNTPEIKALRAIKERNTANVIPVDIQEDPFDGRLEAMLELFRKEITEHFYATEIQANETYRLGFPFLNSEDSDRIFRDKDSMERGFVARVNQHELLKTYSNWLEWNDKRESHWIQVIHEAFEKNKEIRTAVFLVGSAHRIRLIEKIKSFEDTSELIPNWDFYPFK